MLRRSDLLPSHQRYELKKAIKEFWSHPKFDEVAPKCAFNEVEGLVDKAVDIILYIRSHLHLVEWKINLISGSVQEYLHGLDVDPRTNPDAFVSGIVHAALRNNEGYISNIKSEQVDELIKQFKDSPKQNAQAEDIKADIEKLLPTFNDLLKDTLARPVEGHTSKLQQVLASLRTICATLERTKPATEAPKSEIASAEAVDKLAEKVVERDEKLAETAAALNNAATELIAESKAEGSPVVQKDSATTVQPPTEPSAPAQVSSPGAAQTESPSENAPAQTEVPSETAPAKADPLRDSGVIKIQRVASEVALTRSKIEHVIDESQGLDFENLKQDPIEGEKVVDTLNKKCLRYSEDLMKDLLALDSVTTSDQSRPLRKQQINMIQDLLGDVDRIKEKLNSMKTTISAEKEAKLAEQRAREPPAPEPVETAAQKTEEEGYKSDDEGNAADTPPEARQQITPTTAAPRETERQMWSRLKFEPKFEISQDGRGYTLQAYIPGMDKNDISINTSEDGSLVISGLRVPSQKDKAAMSRQLSNQFPFAARSQDRDALLLRLGAGRYGSFEERFRLPGNVDTSNISASYQGNELEIRIPKIPQVRRAPQQQYSRGYPPQYNRNYGRGFNDMFW